MKHLLVLATALVVASATATIASPINVPNGSFDSPSGDHVNDSGVNNIDDFFFSDPNGYSGTQGLVENGFSPTGTSTGANFAFLNLNSVGDIGSISYNGPSLGIIAANTTYTLTVALGNGPALDTANFGAPGTDTIQLTAGGNTIATATTVVPAALIPNGTFTDFTATFTTGAVDSLAGQQLGIVLSSVNANALGNGVQSDFDNVRLDATSVSVPEPSTYAMLFGGVGMLALLARFRKLA